MVFPIIVKTKINSVKLNNIQKDLQALQIKQTDLKLTPEERKRHKVDI